MARMVEGLIFRELCMRLYHLGLPAHTVGDVTVPPAASGGLLLASAAPSGRRRHLPRRSDGLGDITIPPATPDNLLLASACLGGRRRHLPCRQVRRREGLDHHRQFLLRERVHGCGCTSTGADDGGWGGGGGGVRLPMESLYDGALFVLFEMVVVRLMEVLGRTEGELRACHTNPAFSSFSSSP